MSETIKPTLITEQHQEPTQKKVEIIIDQYLRAVIDEHKSSNLILSDTEVIKNILGKAITEDLNANSKQVQNPDSFLDNTAEEQMNKQQTANFLGVSVRTVERYLQKKRIKVEDSDPLLDNTPEERYLQKKRIKVENSDPLLDNTPEERYLQKKRIKVENSDPLLDNTPEEQET